MKNKIVFVLLFFAFKGYSQYPGGMFSKNPLPNLETFDTKRMSYGFFLGFNSFDYKFDYKHAGPDILVERTVGFNVGLLADLRLTNYLNLRFEPGLFFNQRILHYANQLREIDAVRPVDATYISFPLLLKFSALRTGNIKPFMIGGLSTSLNLSSNSKSIDDNLQRKFRTVNWSNNYELGLGIDIYFQYFKFSPSVRGVFGIGNELIYDNDPNSPWTGNVDSMKTRAILVSFCFQ